MDGGVYISTKQQRIVHQNVWHRKTTKDNLNQVVRFKNVSTHTHATENKIHMTRLQITVTKHVTKQKDTAILAPINTVNQLAVVSVLHV